MRDINLESTIYPRFTTRAFATGIPTTLAGTPVLSVYEENNLTQITAGVSVTVDYDTVTGLNQATIVATAANGYEAGKSYDLVITTGTVSGVSVVGEVVFSFTIEAAWNEVDVTKWLGTAVATPTTAGVPSVALTAIGLDAIVSTATGAIEIAKAIWDRVLTGATHNIATSAGRRLRGIQDFQGYEQGAIWVDTINGTAGTIDYENGTVENAVLTWADALTLNASLGFNKFVIKGPSVITLSANSDNYHIIGSGSTTLILNGQSVIGITVENCIVSGTMAGIGTTQRFFDCSLSAITMIKGCHFHRCSVTATQTQGEAGDTYYDNSHSGIAGTATWVFNFGVAIGNTNLNVRHYSGGIQLEAMGDTGTDTMSLEGHGQIIEGTCTSGIVAIRGHFTTSGITNLTLVDGARFESAQLVDDIWDEVVTGHTTNNTTGKILKGISEGWISAEASVNDASATTTSFITDLTSAVDSFYSNTTLAFITGALKGQSRPIITYNGTTKTVTFDEAFSSAPANTDQFIILNGHTHPISEIQAGLATEAKQDIIDTNVDNLNLGIIYGAAATGTLSTTQATSALTGYADDQLIGRVLVVTSGAAEGEATDITDYASASGLLTFTALTVAMANGDTFKIV